ncbi:MAG: hypothetical protein F6K10_14910 [Moorea sp. SIO2B7]|nr:hypothetical protein [Moorena sp. SIO2B7]
MCCNIAPSRQLSTQFLRNVNFVTLAILYWALLIVLTFSSSIQEASKSSEDSRSANSTTIFALSESGSHTIRIARIL